MLTLTAVVANNAGPGHGECFLWKRDGEPAICVDAGGAKSAGLSAAAMNPSILILSHDDKDHIGGAVELIRRSSSTLQELWIPVEWAILIKQLAETDNSTLFWPGLAPESPEVVAEIIAAMLAAAEDRRGVNDSVQQSSLQAYLPEAKNTLEALITVHLDNLKDDEEADAISKILGWYGASSIKEILDRVKLSGGRITAIIGEAMAHGLRIRFFSIDLALRSGSSEAWLNSGCPGIATIANANEAPFWQAVTIPPGILFSYMLCRLTVQNRRALSTLLWSNHKSPLNAVMIWSDTDGDWLDVLSPKGFKTVTQNLLASSAPHHASGNPAHARAWKELSIAPAQMVMISAGGQSNQNYCADYNALGQRRACTWCRGNSVVYQQVLARGTATAGMTIQNPCLSSNHHV